MLDIVMNNNIVTHIILDAVYEGSTTPLLAPISVQMPYDEIADLLKSVGFKGCRSITSLNSRTGQRELWVNFSGDPCLVSFEDIFDEIDLIKTFNRHEFGKLLDKNADQHKITISLLGDM